MTRNHEINWRFIPFSALTTQELYEMLQLRSEVFVVEQACPFQDMDGADQKAMHLLGTKDGKLVAYARCFAAGEKFAEASIGRVVTHMSARGGGIPLHLTGTTHDRQRRSQPQRLLGVGGQW